LGQLGEKWVGGKEEKGEWAELVKGFSYFLLF
jgi:hypothetical protein